MYYGLAQVRKWCYAANSFTGVNASPSFHHTACWWDNFAVWGLIWKYTVEKSRVQVEQWSYAANSFTGVTASLSFHHHNWARIKLLIIQTAKQCRFIIFVLLKILQNVKIKVKWHEEVVDSQNPDRTQLILWFLSRANKTKAINPVGWKMVLAAVLAPAPPQFLRLKIRDHQVGWSLGRCFW